jgi:4-hydroxy-3-polyprenylbenzoate decarboxylase
MAWKNLQEFVWNLEKQGQLKRISTAVDWNLEVTEIADRLIKTEGPALLFENVSGSKVPLAINLFGTRSRMEQALGVQHLDEIARRVESLLEIPNASGLVEKLSLIPKLAEAAQFPPKRISKPPCQEVVERDNPSLLDLPILQCWPEDAGRYVTFGGVITQHPETGKRNVGLYRLQVVNEKTLLMHWQIHKDAADHYRKYGDGKMPVAVAIGGDPATIYSASAPLPEGMDELLFAGFLRKSPVTVAKGVSIDLEVPAEAEIVIEGYVDVSAPKQVEGPFGDHTGYYSLPEPYPALQVSAITHRKNPLYLTTIVGRPPMEDLWLGKTTERAFLPIIRKMVPEIVDMNFPAEGIFNNAVIVSVQKTYPGQARKVAHALWGLGQMTFTKVIILVDSWVNVHNLSEVGWLTFMNIDPKRDCFFVDGPVDNLNHASPVFNYGSKMGIDATRKFPEEGHPRTWPEPITMPKEVQEKVTRRWAEYGLDGLSRS